MKRRGESEIGCLVVIGVLVIFAIIAHETFKSGVESGRIDIASGRVIGERVTNADGLTEWKWKEAK